MGLSEGEESFFPLVELGWPTEPPMDEMVTRAAERDEIQRMVVEPVAVAVVDVKLPGLPLGLVATAGADVRLAVVVEFLPEHIPRPGSGRDREALPNGKRHATHPLVSTPGRGGDSGR